MEEWYPMVPFGAGLREGKGFPRGMEASRSSATGWFTFFFEVLKCAGGTITGHLRQFGAGAEAVRSAGFIRPPAPTMPAIHPEKLWRSGDEVDRLLPEYQVRRRPEARPDFAWEDQGR